MLQKNVSLKIPDKIGSVFLGDADYRGAYGGRGGAKTIAFAKMAVAYVMKPSPMPWKFLCGRELQKSLKDSVFSVIATQIEALGVQDAFEVGKEFIRCKNGNEFLFYGLRTNIAEVKGLHGVKITWLEEAQKVSQSSLNYLIPTVMRDFEDCELWATWNPEDEDDPIHKMFTADADETFKVCKINWYDNPWFPKALDKVRLRDKKNNPEQYEWIWEGKFNTNPHAAVYAKWVYAAESAGRVKRGIYDPSLPIHTAWDLGYSDDTAIVFFQIAGNEVRVIDYYENNREGIKHYIEQMIGYKIEVLQYGDNGVITRWMKGAPIEGLEHRNDYAYGNHYVPHDAANKLLQAGGRSTVEQAFELGVKMTVVAATSQQNQIDAARVTIDHSWFDLERCELLLRNLKKYQFKYDEAKNRYSKDPIHDGFSHGCDAFEVLAQVWKSVKLPEAAPKPRFLNEMTINELFESSHRGDSGRI